MSLRFVFTVIYTFNFAASQEQKKEDTGTIMYLQVRSKQCYFAILMMCCLSCSKSQSNPGYYPQPSTSGSGYLASGGSGSGSGSGSGDGESYYYDGTCTSQDYKCPTDGRCVPIEWKCDGAQDCAHGPDDSHSQLKSLMIH